MWWIVQALYSSAGEFRQTVCPERQFFHQKEKLKKYSCLCYAGKDSMIQHSLFRKYNGNTKAEPKDFPSL